MNHRHPLGLAAAVALSLCGGAAVHAASDITLSNAVDPGHINGVWISSRFNPDRDAERGGPRESGPPDGEAAVAAAGRGRAPALLPWAQQILASRAAEEKAGHPVPNAKALCLPAGTPGSMSPPAALPLNILVTKDQVTVLFEEFSYFRIIRMNQPHLKDPDPSYFGDSVGHWEGDTLVVDTIGISTKTTLGNGGAPHSDELHVVERIHRTGASTLEIQAVMEDPKAFVGQWTTRTELKTQPGLQLEEYYCVNDRNTPDANGRTGVTLAGGN